MGRPYEVNHSKLPKSRLQMRRPQTGVLFSAGAEGGSSDPSTLFHDKVPSHMLDYATDFIEALKFSIIK